MTDTVLAQRAAGRIPYRLRVGVTGHRNLQDEAPLADQVRLALERVRELAPSSDSTPLRLAVVSPLAEGADRIVAHVALEDPETILEAPLPRPEEDYLTDFDAEASKSEFRELLGRAAAVSVQPRHGSHTVEYERVGHYVVDSSDVVIALWDGQPSRGQGGTAEIVDYAREHGAPLLWIQATSPHELTEEPDGGIPKEAFRELDRYNAGRIGGVDLTKDVDARTDRYLAVAAAKDVNLRSDYVKSFCEWILPHYVRADALADRAQAWYHRLGNIVLLSAAGAVVATAAQVVFAPGHPELAAIEVTLMAIALGAVGAGRWFRPHGRWLAYRFLAERFRSAFFLGLAGVWGGRDSPPEEIRLGRLAGAAGEQERRDDWVRRAFLEVWTHRPEPTTSEDDTARLKGFLGTAWIDDQLRYHDGVSKKYERRHRLLSRLSSILFAVTLVAAALHAADVAGLESEGALSWSNGLILLSIGLPAVAGSVGAFHAQREYERNSERSRGMVRRLQAAKGRLDMATDLEGVRAAALDIEQVMVDENDDWLVTMRFQDIKARV